MRQVCCVRRVLQEQAFDVRSLKAVVTSIEFSLRQIGVAGMIPWSRKVRSVLSGMVGVTGTERVL